MPPLLLQAILFKGNKKQQEATRQQRLEQHTQNEQKRPEDQRLLTRTDLDKQAYQFYARSTLLGYATSIRCFSEFCEDVLHLPEGAGRLYFERNSPSPDTKMIRQFVFYLADSSRRGKGPDSIISRRTAAAYATSLFGALAYSNNPIEKEVQSQVYIWIQYDLTEELKLNKALAVSKPTANHNDVTLVLQNLFSPLGLRQVMSMRVLLNITIFINLMLDTCGRIHEIVSSEAYPELYLRWKDLRVYVFKRNRKVSLSAILHIGNLKGGKDNPMMFKNIPLFLLPSSFCFEDSLRLLLIAALIDGHIEGARTWADLERVMSLCNSEFGQLLPFKEGSQELPLIPALNHALGKVVIQSPVKPDFIPRQLKRAGKLCGFKDIFKSNALRRGAAQTLEACSTPEFRTWAMGHGPGSCTYLKYYAGSIAKQDIQAMMHGLPQQDVSHLGGMSLGRAESAPQRLSPEGLDAVMSDPQIRLATNKCTEALDALTLRYHSVAAASVECSAEYQNYKAVKDALRTLTTTLRKRQQQKEYQAHLDAAGVLSMSLATEDSLIGGYLLEDSLQEEDLDDSYLSNEEEAVFLSSVDQDILSTEDFLKVSRGEIDEAFEFLNMEEAEGNGDVYDQDELGDEFGGDKTDSSWCLVSQGLIEDPEAEDTLGVSAGISNSMEGAPTKLHGIYKFHARERHAEGSYFESDVFLPHRHDKIWEDATQPGQTDQEVAALLMPFFMTMHALERYGAHEPRPSTFICNWCSVDQVTKSDFDMHVTRCRKAMVLTKAEGDWRAALDTKMTAPCDWKLSRIEHKLCGRTFDDYTKYIGHVTDHSRRNVKELCRYGDCVKIKSPPELSTRDAWSDHLADVHQLTLVRSSSLVFYCAFCNDYITFGIAGPSPRESHYESHLIEALNRIEKYGYSSVESTAGAQYVLASRQPFTCVFCCHDKSLSPSARLSVTNERIEAYQMRSRRDHLCGHFVELADGLRHCPASAAADADHPLCSSTALFTAQSLEDHLLEQHSVLLVKGLAERKPVAKKARKGAVKYD